MAQHTSSAIPVPWHTETLSQLGVKLLSLRTWTAYWASPNQTNRALAGKSQHIPSSSSRANSYTHRPIPVGPRRASNASFINGKCSNWTCSETRCHMKVRKALTERAPIANQGKVRVSKVEDWSRGGPWEIFGSGGECGVELNVKVRSEDKNETVQPMKDFSQVSWDYVCDIFGNSGLW